ncbi:hypothetical protein [Deinococcus ruber]|uniref:Uncharacterized protein n=1 Tax=Deinococcus ruber TaxID=1848197 RepID=A0A918CAT2_9DEIO|nr:hypothetical protein [Deinococcus ruber]GGR12068.1 hypothetical protein GCM10008957_26160 [Deinococcus ruber]
MAHPDLKALIPGAARTAYRDGDELRAALLLRRAREGQRPGTPGYAVLERLEGLLLIAVQREVEGTFALERADTVLDEHGLGYPELDWLDDRG